MLKFLTSSTESSQSASGGTEPHKTGTDEPPTTSTEQSYAISYDDIIDDFATRKCRKGHF